VGETRLSPVLEGGETGRAMMGSGGLHRPGRSLPAGVGYPNQRRKGFFYGVPPKGEAGIGAPRAGP